MMIYKKYVIIALIGRFACAIADLLIPKILATMIDEVVLNNSLGNIYYWALLMAGVGIASFTTGMIANYCTSNASTKVGENVRRDLFAKTMELSSAQVDRVTIASLETRMTADTYNIQMVIGMMLRLGIRSPIMLIGCIILSFTLDFVLALVLVAILPIIVVIICIISHRGMKLYTIVQKKEDLLVGTIRENVLGIRVIKALAAKVFEKEKFQEINHELKESDIKATLNMIRTNPLISFILNIASVTIIILGATRVLGGYCNVGALLALMTYFTIILTALMGVSRIFIMTTKGIASANRIQEILEFSKDLEVEEIKCENVAREGFIEFDHVDFSYHGKNQDIHQMNLKNIHFSLKKGQTLGIIGATGSGKSTLLLLLMRFYDVAKGGVYIGDRNVKTIPKDELYGMFGVAMQSDYLFSDSILENISFGRDLVMEQVEEALRVAQAESFVQKYEDSYEHKLTIKGSNLSGGQKQRLLIARAVAAIPDILILDDSSSALDYKTDALMRKELNKITKDTTTILVAQRIGSIQHADTIIIMENGEILDIGKHEELLQRCSLYKTLSEHQLGDRKGA